jgi:hypothetical protein
MEGVSAGHTDGVVRLRPTRMGVVAATIVLAAAAAWAVPRTAEASWGPELKRAAETDAAAREQPLAPKKDARKLERASCPARYHVRVRREYGRDVVQQARRWRFRIGGAEVNVKPPMDWRTDPIGSSSFRARLHDLRWLDVLLHDYRAHGRRASLRKAKRIAVDWVKHNPRSDPSTDRTWFDKVSGDRAPYLAYVTRAASCEGMLRRKLARRMLASLSTHGNYLQRGSTHTRTNRGLFVDLGLLNLGKQARFLKGAGKWRQRGKRRFARTVRQLTFRHEGFWLEHSTTYQFLAMNIIGSYLDTPGVEEPRIEQLLERMREMSGWLIAPDNRWLQAGNSYHEAANKETRERAREARGMRVLRRSGLGFVRTGRRYLAVLAGFHSPIHKHSDELSFDLFDNGRRVVSDSGMYSKDPSPYLDFQESAQAHSTLTVDGEDFSRVGTDAYGSGILAAGRGGGWYALEATNPLLASQEVAHTRLYLYRPRAALIVADRVRSGEQHEYRRYLHLGHGLGLRESGDRLELHRDGRIVTTVFSSSTDPLERRRTVRGQEQPPQGFVFPSFRDRDSRWTAWFDSTGSDVDHVLTVAMNRNRPPQAQLATSLDANPRRFTVDREGEHAYTLVVRRDGNSLSVRREQAPEPASG